MLSVRETMSSLPKDCPLPSLGKGSVVVSYAGSIWVFEQHG